MLLTKCFGIGISLINDYENWLTNQRVGVINWSF